MLTKDTVIPGKRYNWKNQSERLVYRGRLWSGNGYWHQFSLVENPTEIWCEVLDDELDMLEETEGGDRAN